MFLRNLGMIALALLATGCVTTAGDDFECEPVCELVEVCEESEECKPELVEVGTELICEVSTVDIEREVCNTYEDTVSSCVTGDVAYTALVAGTGSVTYTDTSCVTSGVTQGGTVCGTGEYSFTETDCDDDAVTTQDEACDTSSVTKHRVIDFETGADGSVLASGTWGASVEDAYSDWGVAISVANYNGSSTSTGLALFDSESPTGNDWDLGTSNEDWGGPGDGSGGEDTNFFERGNVLIHAEDLGDSNGDGLLDDPDDEASGATFTFEFDEEVCLKSITLIDVESSENGYLYAYDASGSTVLSQQIIGLGNNSIQIVDPDVCGVTEVVFEMCGSGAIDELYFTADEDEETCVSYDYECTDTTCTDTVVTDEVEVCSDYEVTCDQSVCTETEVTQSVTTETQFGYTCSETTCTETIQEVEVCETHTFTEEVEACVEVPKHEAVVSCETIETCTEEEVCDDSECDPDKEWLSGGGPVGSK